MACSSGDLKTVSFFVKHGAQLRVGRSDGVILACKDGHMDVVSYLLENMKREVCFCFVLFYFVDHFFLFSTYSQHN